MTITPDTHNTPEAMDAFWASVDDGYFADREWMYDFVAGYIEDFLPSPEGTNRVYEFGCGCGQLLARFIDRMGFGKGMWVGVDYSLTALEKAKDLCRAIGWRYLTYYAMDISSKDDWWPDGNTDSSMANKGDLVFCVQTLEHIRDYRIALVRMVNVLKPGGSLIITVPNNDGWHGHHNHWTPETFRELLETYGEVAECMTFGRNEGDDTNILARVVKV